MFLGHFAAAFAAKRFAPRASLGVLVAAPLLLDLLWPVFLLLGWEHVRVEPGRTAVTPLAFVHYPISHSLLAAAGWALSAALVYLGVARYRRGAVAVGLLVLSHWLLDAVVHEPDLPLYPAGPLVGLGLWDSVWGTVLAEGLLFAAGLWLYQSATRARDRVGRYGFAAFVLFLLLIYASNLAGPPPPGVTALALFALSAWLLPFAAAWFDAHREPTGKAAG
jgi:hypothetical protein